MMGAQEKVEETDLIFVPYGIFVSIAIVVGTLEGVLRPCSFWAGEAAGFFGSVVAIFALRPKDRWIADTILVVLSLLAGAVLVYHATMSP